MAFDFICVSIFFTKVAKISDCECPDSIQNETPVRFLYGTQKNVRSDRAESILALPIRSRFGYSSMMDTRFCFVYQLSQRMTT